MATVDVTKENFEEIVTKNSLVILDFWAAWCGPCKAFAPAFEAASEKYPDVVFGKINTEEQQELAGHFQIRSIPNVMLFRDQIVLFSQPGAMPPAGIDSVIEQAKALDMNKVRAEIAEAEAQGGGDVKP
ncbi:MAG TPA: thioredoxin [Burkholderiales bacterium]|jgi:thioredoxin 1|nr:thioredoxin [Burkholderiales bacterium]